MSTDQIPGPRWPADAIDKPRDGDYETVTVEAEHFGGPVDPPPLKTTWAEVVSKHNERRPILPATLRNPDQRRAASRELVGITTHHALYHVSRTPKYASKAALYAPRGAYRLVKKSWRWAYDMEQWGARQQAINRYAIDDYETLMRKADQHRRVRVPIFVLCLFALVVAGAVTVLVATLWAQLIVGVTALAILARAGRPEDKPILDRVSYGQRFTRLTAEQVREALVSLGIAGIKDPGQLRFAEPGIHRDGPGWLARVNLPAGVEAVKVLERRGGLSSALRLPVDQVWPAAGPDHAGQLDLWVGFQPASKMGKPRWSLAADNARTSVFDEHEFGTDQRQRPVKTVLFERNFLIGGVPGSGKSYAARTIATIAALDPTCELKIAEFKGTADFGDFAPMCSTYACGVDEQSIGVGMAILTWGLAEAERRGERIRKARQRGLAPHGKVTPELAAMPGSGLHPVVIIIDEAHELFLDGTYGKDAAVAAERLIKRGRALNIIVVLATQIPDTKSVPASITRCVNMRWCLAVQDWQANDMILGTGSYKRGLSATVYRPGIDAGWGMLTGLAEPTVVRSHFPDPKTTEAIVARATALRGGQVVGENVQAMPRRDVLNDVLRVFAYAGRRSLHWETLAELLAEQMPEAYDGVTQESISALVRDHGVPSEQVKVGGENRQGCKRAEIEAAIQRREITQSPQTPISGR